MFLESLNEKEFGATTFKIGDKVCYRFPEVDWYEGYIIRFELNNAIVLLRTVEGAPYLCEEVTPLVHIIHADRYVRDLEELL